MKEKELKKLSRLELLELLLEQSKENEALKEKLNNSSHYQNNDISVESLTLKSTERMVRETNRIVKDIALLISTGAAVSETKKISDEERILSYLDNGSASSSAISDRQLFNRLIVYFSQNPNLLDYFSKDLRDELVAKLDELYATK